MLIFFICPGLAVASDQDFKSFQAAYPYVVQKLLYNNSAATRRILYSVLKPFSELLNLTYMYILGCFL